MNYLALLIAGLLLLRSGYLHARRESNVWLWPFVGSLPWFFWGKSPVWLAVAALIILPWLGNQLGKYRAQTPPRPLTSPRRRHNKRRRQPHP